MKLKDQLQGFLLALQADDPTDFLQAVQDHVGRREGNDLEELLQAVQRKDVVAVCLGLKHQVELGIELFASEDVTEEGQEGGQQELGAEVLYCAAILTKLVLAQNKEAPPEALQQAAGLLHDHALLGADGYLGLQDEVAKLCLEWWQAEAAGRDLLTPQTVPYLLMKAITTGTAADVKRCHSMRTALQLFDFDDPSIADVKRLLLQVAFTPSFLRCAEGRRMVAYLFTLQPAFVGELTAIIKNQIIAGRKSVLCEYGQIIYRAWSACTGACLLAIQQNCIQALMEAAILASTPAMAASIRRVLNGLHTQKHQPGVDKMLLELYEPILFRRLNAANPDVRRNALHVLVDAFPLRDPDESNQDTDKRLNDQFAHLTNLLKDAVPEVRVAAIHGVCRILNEFWELIPGNVTARYIKLMAGELAFDGSSPAVRAAVAGGLAMLVENALAHPLLKVVLPQVEPLLFDSATKVRTAMVDLLLSLRGCETLPFHTIVPVEKLLDIMAVDVAPVSERIQRLLLPAFFPNKDTGPAMVAYLLRKSPGAGRAFCQYLVGTYQPSGGDVVVTAAGPPVNELQIVALIKDLRAHLLGAPISSTAVIGAGESGSVAGAKGAKKGRSKRKKAQPQQRGDAEEEDTEHEVVESPESWEAILQGLRALVCGLAALVAAGRCEEHVGHALFLSGTLVQLLDRCPSATARQAVMAIAAAFPALDASQEVRGRCLKHMLAGDYSLTAAQHADELRGAVECICAGDCARGRLLKVLVTSLNGEPAEVLAGLCKPADAPGALGEAAAGPAEGEAGARGKQGSKKAELAKPAPKKKGKKGAAETADEEVGEVDESLACEKCGSRARSGEMLLCDNCDAAYHVDCLEPALTELPEGDWFCPECDTMMSSGMGKDLAIRCLSLLLELEGQREQLVTSGVLERLLPYVEIALQDRVDALKQALSQNTSTAEVDDQASASSAMIVYMKGCLHLSLAGQGAARSSGAASAAGMASASMTSQATECTQQAIDWASALLQQLASLDCAALLQAVGSRQAPEAKRNKVSKKKAAVTASQPGGGAAAAVKEAFATVQACMLVLTEAARVQVLSWAVPVPSLAQAACTLAQQWLGVVGGMAAMASAHSISEAAEADDVVAAAVSNVARLARNLAVAAKLSGRTSRDLNSALQQVQREVESEQGSLATAGSAARDVPTGVGAVEAVVANLIQLGCQESTSSVVVAAVRPSLAALLGALCDAAGSRRDGGGGWLRPVAQLLGRGIELDDVPLVRPEPAAEQSGEGNENAGVAANQAADQDAVGQADRQAEKAAGSVDLTRFGSKHAEQPLVKQLLAAAKLAKVQEQLAGYAAGVGLGAFEEGSVRTALGAVELSTLLGFKGVTSRGKSRAGTDTYVCAIQQLRLLKDAVDGLAAADLQEAKALLHHKLQHLFPPAPRVTFGAV